MKNYKNLVFVLFVIGILVMVSCKKTETTEKPKPVKQVFDLSLNGEIVPISSIGANISYLLNSDTNFLGSYRITLSIDANIGGANNLNFSAWCYDIHNPNTGSIRTKKYFVEPSRCDCRAYRDTTLCDGCSLTFNLGETIYTQDNTDVTSFINITACEASTKIISGNILVKSIATTDANNVQIVGITFSNIPYKVLN